MYTVLSTVYTNFCMQTGLVGAEGGGGRRPVVSRGRTAGQGGAPSGTVAERVTSSDKELWSAVNGGNVQSKVNYD